MGVDNTNLLQKLPIFSGLPTSEIQAMSKAACIRHYKKDEPLFRHGDATSHVYIVSEGAVRLHRQTPEGKEVTLHIATGGEMIGEHDLLEEKKNHQMTATATENSVALEYSTRFIQKALKDYPHFTLNMLTALARKSSRSTIENEHLLTLKAPQRIGCFMLRLCYIHDLDPQHFTLPYSKSTVASKLGMEPESFSRALIKLKEIGVSISGNEVCIADMERLEEYVCSSCSISVDCETCEELHSKENRV